MTGGIREEDRRGGRRRWEEENEDNMRESREAQRTELNERRPTGGEREARRKKHTNQHMVKRAYVQG